MKTLSSLIKVAASSAFVFAFTFEGLIGLGANLEKNRALMEERVRVSQTAYGIFNEQAADRNMSALDQYNGTLKAEYKIYGCSAAKPCR